MILLRAFQPDIGNDVVSSWYDDYQNLPVVRARLNILMIHLREQARDSWVHPYYDTLRDGVGEVRFKANSVNHRPLGYFGNRHTNWK